MASGPHRAAPRVTSRSSLELSPALHHALRAAISKAQAVQAAIAAGHHDVLKAGVDRKPRLYARGQQRAPQHPAAGAAQARNVALVRARQHRQRRP